MKMCANCQCVLDDETTICPICGNDLTVTYQAPAQQQNLDATTVISGTAPAVNGAAAYTDSYSGASYSDTVAPPPPQQQNNSYTPVSTVSPSKVMTLGIIAAALCETGIPGIILGAIARKKAKLWLAETHSLKFEGQVKVGAILGKIGLIFGIITTVALVISIVANIVIAIIAANDGFIVY